MSENKSYAGGALLMTKNGEKVTILKVKM